jgi:hypothetical protein
MERAERKRADLAVSDHSELRALRDFLSWAIPGVQVLHIPGRRIADGQREPDMLAVLASASGMVPALKILPEFLMSRRTALSITITVDGESAELTTANADDVLPILQRLIRP